MPDAEAKLKVTIETAATGSGAPQSAAALKDVAGAAGQAAPAMQKAGAGAKEMGGALGKSVEIGGATTALMQNLAVASQGGATGMFAAGRAILSFGQIVKGVLLGAGPVGIAVAVLGALAGAAFALKEAFAAPKKSVEELGKQLDGAKASGEALAKVSYDNQLAALKQVNELLAKQIEKAKAAAAAQEEISAAMDATAKLEIDAQVRLGKKSEGQATAEKAGIDAAAAGRAAQGRLASIQTELDAYKQALARAESIAALPRTTAYSAGEQLAQAEAARQALSRAEIERAAVQREMDRPYAELGDAEREALAARKEASDAAYKAARDAAQRAYGTFDVAGKEVPVTSQPYNAAFPDQTPGLAELRKTYDQAIAAWKPNGEAVESLTTKVQELDGQLADRTKVEKALASERQKQRAAEGTKVPDAETLAKNEEARKRAEAAADFRTRQTSSAQLAQRIRSGMDVDIESARRVYPLFKFPEKPEAPLSGQSTPSTPSTPGTLTDFAGRVHTATAAGGQPAAGGGTVTIGGVTTTFPAGGAIGTAPTLTMGGQTYTGGSAGLKPAGQGSDKLAEQTQQLNQTMRETGKQAEEKLDLQPAVEGAEKVQQGQEAMREAIDQATQSQAEAMQAARQAQDQTVAKLGEVVSAQNSLRSDFAALERRVAAMSVA